MNHHKYCTSASCRGCHGPHSLTAGAIIHPVTAWSRPVHSLIVKAEFHRKLESHIDFGINPLLSLGLWKQIITNLRANVNSSSSLFPSSGGEVAKISMHLVYSCLRSVRGADLYLFLLQLHCLNEPHPNPNPSSHCVLLSLMSVSTFLLSVKIPVILD